MARREITSSHYQGEWIRTQAFIPDLNGTAMLSGTGSEAFGTGGSNDASVALHVYDMSNPETDIAASASLTTPPWASGLTFSTIFETAVASWSLDSTGYTFDHIVGADADGEDSGVGDGAALLALFEAGKTYLLEYICTPNTDFTASGPVVLKHYVKILPTLSVAP